MALRSGRSCTASRRLPWNQFADQKENDLPGLAWSYFYTFDQIKKHLRIFGIGYQSTLQGLSKLFIYLIRLGSGGKVSQLCLVMSFLPNHPLVTQIDSFNWYLLKSNQFVQSFACNIFPSSGLSYAWQPNLCAGWFHGYVTATAKLEIAKEQRHKSYINKEVWQKNIYNHKYKII